MTGTFRRPEHGDVVLGVIVTVISFGLLAFMPALGSVEEAGANPLPTPTEWPWWLALFALLAQGARLAWVSIVPRHVLVSVAAIALLASLAPIGEAWSLLLLAVMAASYVTTRRRVAGESWVPLIVAAVLVAAAGTLSNLRLDNGVLIPVAAALGQAAVVVAVPAAVAAAANARTAISSSREREAIARAGELEARMQASVAAERTAIARELHDIAAHHLSGIALMSSAISQQIDTDPATAKAGLADVRAQTRTLLDELRGLVALLRQDDGASVDVESLSGLETLIPVAAARGLDVELRIPEGASISELARRIGPLAQFAAYRTVQEALSNAARHSPHSRCTVELSDGADRLEIVVSNDGGSSGPARSKTSEGAGSGFGLRGMEERASLTRSRLSYGPTDDGGWRVALRVPREPAPDTDLEGDRS